MFSKTELKALYPRGSDAHIANFSSQSKKLFDEFGIGGSPNRWQFFLAQIGHESGGLSVLVENLSYSAERILVVWPNRFKTLADAKPFARNPERLANTVYADRMGNGPPASGDGFRFRGRGYIQITGRDGYEQIGKRVGLDLINNPELAVAPETALRVVCGFWKWKDLNPLCDTGDFAAVTRRINGGITGFADRKAWLDKVRRTFAKPPVQSEQPPVAEVIDLQRHLQQEGFREIGAADGDVGPRTIAALQNAEQRGKLPNEGPLRKLIVALGIGKKKRRP